LRTPSADFVAPDNGVLSYIIRQSSAELIKDYIHLQIELGAEMEAIAITNPHFWQSSPSSTFHGRDIFAPVAAYLSLGSRLTDFGETITSVTMLSFPHLHSTENGAFIGHILHIDSFGNLITNIKSDDMIQTKQSITIEIGNQLIHGLSHTYAEGNRLLALIGSSGYLEISLKEGNAQAFLNAEIGDEIRVK
jgi:S-adenosylmethionine hydrolase